MRNIIQDFTLSLDGETQHAGVKNFTPGTMKLATQDFRPAGYDMAVSMDMGMEKIVVKFDMFGHDSRILARFGVAPGQRVALWVRAAMTVEEGRVEAAKWIMQGKVVEIVPETITPGEAAGMSVTYEPVVYRYMEGAHQITHIDVANKIRVINGVDQLAAQRAAMGL